MSSTNNIQNRDREVIRLLYDLLLRWDHILRYTHQILQSIANRNESLNQIERTFQSSPEEIRLSQTNQTNKREAQNFYSSRMGSSTSVQNPVTQLAEKSDQIEPKEEDSSPRSQERKTHVTQLAEKSDQIESNSSPRSQERKTHFVIDVNESKNKKSETNPKKIAKKETNLSANEELEENLAKLDEVIDYYNELKTRIYRTLISRPKNSKAAKDVILELKDVIKKFDNNKEI